MKIDFFKHLQKIIFIVLVFSAFGLLLSRNTPPTQAQINPLSDQDGDGLITGADARIVSPPESTSCPVCVDVTGDGIVDEKDEKRVRYYFGYKSREGKTYRLVDLNRDNEIDQGDVNIVNNYKGQTSAGGTFGLDQPKELGYGYKARTLVLLFEDDVSEETKQNIFAQHNLSKIRDFYGSSQMYVSTQNDDLDGLIKELKGSHTEIKEASKHSFYGEAQTNDPYWNQQWGAQLMRFQETWFTETTGVPNVKVAVLDTGVWLDHPDLSGVNFVDIYDAISRSTDPADINDTEGHGTAMIGILAANINNGIAIAGLAPNVSVMPVKILEDVDDLGLCFTFNFEEGLQWAIDHGADIISMSFGCGQSGTTDSRLTYANTIEKITLVAAAGNAGSSEGAIYPANHQNVIGVGAIGQDGFGQYICSDSNRGPGVDVYAPGLHTPALHNNPQVKDGTRIITGCATSPSTVYYAAVHALRRSVCKDDKDNDDYCANIIVTFGDYNRNEYYPDAWSSAWYSNCFKVDFVHDHYIDFLDNYLIAYFWGTQTGHPQYQQRFDVQPFPGGDGDIDVGDVQFAWGRPYHQTCPSWHLHQ